MNKVLTSFAVGALMTAVTPALAAAPQTVAEIANYSGADRQEMLEAGAKKEGMAMIYTPGTQTQSLFEALGKKYPFVRVELYRAPAADSTRRAIEENKAGRPLVDVFDNTTGSQHILLDSGILTPFSTPDLVNYKKDAKEPGGHWVLDFEFYMNLAYNTQAVPDAPRTYDDVLDPKWKGKLTLSARGSTIPHTVGILLLYKGEDFVRKLAQQEFRVFQITARGLANLVVSGEAPISLATYSSHVANSQAKGAPIAWQALGPSYATVGATSLSKTAPHPHAAMLTIDFLLSQQGQAMRQELGYATARTDMTNAAKPDKVEYLTERPNYAAEYEKWAALSRQLFAKNSNPPDGFVDSGED